MLSALIPDGWIRVEDELPPFDTPVVGICCGESPVGGVYELIDDGDFLMWAIADNIWINTKNEWESEAEIDAYYKVTHWQLLPVIPRAEAKK